MHVNIIVPGTLIGIGERTPVSSRFQNVCVCYLFLGNSVELLLMRCEDRLESMYCLPPPNIRSNHDLTCYRLALLWGCEADGSDGCEQAGAFFLGWIPMAPENGGFREQRRGSGCRGTGR